MIMDWNQLATAALSAVSAIIGIWIKSKFENELKRRKRRKYVRRVM